MPVFRVQVNYTRGTNGKWSNVWHSSGVDITAVKDAWLGFGVPDLLPLLDNSAKIATFLVSDLAGSQFITTAVGAAGTSSASGDTLPLFNSLKALFDDGSLGRPDYKFFKGFLTESIQANGLIASGTITAVETFLATLISDLDANGATLVSSDNDPYASASVQEEVAMRQMHRKRRRTP